MTPEQCAADVRRLQPIIAAKFRHIAEARKAAGVKPGEPLMGYPSVTDEP